MQWNVEATYVIPVHNWPFEIFIWFLKSNHYIYGVIMNNGGYT